MNPMFRAPLLVLLAAALSACGFHLRGAVHLPAHHLPVTVSSSHADLLTASVQEILREQGIALAKKPSSAKLQVKLRDERFDRRVVAVSARGGQLEEIELRLLARLEVTSTCAGELLEDTPVQVLRDYTFKDTEVMAKSVEEEMLRQEMQREAAMQVLRRLQSVGKIPCASS